MQSDAPMEINTTTTTQMTMNTGLDSSTEKKGVLINLFFR